MVANDEWMNHLFGSACDAAPDKSADTVTKVRMAWNAIVMVLGSIGGAWLFLAQADWMDNGSKLIIASMVSLGVFYFYCAILRGAIGGWTKDELEYESHA